jgi:two-component system, chemotaxis family, sensor kinase CheA
MNQDLQQLLMDAFLTEAKERIESMFLNLDALEKTSSGENRAQLLEVVYREAHSLKGAARSVNIESVEALCQCMETLFSAVKENQTDLSPDLFDLLHRAAASIDAFLAGDDSPLPDLAEIAAQLQRVSAMACAPVSTGAKARPLSETAAEDPDQMIGFRVEPSRPPRPSKSPAMDTVRIKTSKLDRLLLKTEELIPLKQMLLQHQERLKTIRDTLRTWIKKSGHPLPVMGDVADLTAALEQNNRLFGAMIDDLLEEVKQTALLPVESLFAGMPPMVRDISRSQGKMAVIEFSGQNLEIDKRILEIIKDPFIHLIRNAVAHGIESPEIRTRAGKPECAAIRVHVSPGQDNSIEISVADDGNGLDIAGIKQSAVNKGILSLEQAQTLEDEDAALLIFHSGVSTSPMITDLAGRGLGMAIVKEKIMGMGGRITIQNLPGRGVIFRVVLPITLSTFRGTLLSSAGHYFIIPTAHVIHVLLIRPEDVQSAENRAIILFKNKPVSLAGLEDILNLPRDPADIPSPPRLKKEKPVLILSTGADEMALMVDEVINEQEVLVKNLGKQIRRIPAISGATILGSGRVVPVINAADLIRIAGERSVYAQTARILSSAPDIKPKSILIVEDSFTSRTLLKNILEATGYQVSTAIDGMDGLEQLKTGVFNAVVADVEMPRKDGISLTREIRSDSRLAALPVVLVTSLDTRQDRERGMEAGADAYIVKSSFDQSNLLEVLERLL